MNIQNNGEETNPLSLVYDLEGQVTIFLPPANNLYVIVNVIDNEYGTTVYRINQLLEVQSDINQMTKVSSDLDDLTKFDSPFILTMQLADISQMSHTVISFVSMLNNQENTTREQDDLYARNKERLIVELVKLNTSHINSVKLLASVYSVLSSKTKQLTKYSAVT